MPHSYFSNYLHKDEKLQEATEDADFTVIDAKVFKETISYVTKRFIFSTKTLQNIPSLFKKPWSRRKSEAELKSWAKITSGLSFQEKVSEWKRKGLLAELIVFKARGTQVRGVYYVPTLQLNAFWQERKIKEAEANEMELSSIREKILGLKNKFNHPGFGKVADLLFKKIEASREITKQIDFLQAVLTAAANSKYFDFKEIGQYSLLQSRTSSKIFDNQKKEFLGLLKNILTDITVIGLTTTAGDYALEFSAKCALKFKFGEFRYDLPSFISKVTAEEIIALEKITTKDIKRLLIVENRAVLRKLVKHISPKKRVQTALVGFDGQIRSSQYRFYQKWCEAEVNELIIWTDFDQYAVSMIEKIMTLPFKDVKIVVPFNDLSLADYHSGIKYFENLKAINSLIEQEDYLKDMERLENLLILR